MSYTEKHFRQKVTESTKFTVYIKEERPDKFRWNLVAHTLEYEPCVIARATLLVESAMSAEEYCWKFLEALSSPKARQLEVVVSRYKEFRPGRPQEVVVSRFKKFRPVRES